MDSEDDLDTHICLRCQTTIVGLNLYVNHKKRECPAVKVKKCAVPSEGCGLVQPVDDTALSEETQSSNPTDLGSNKFGNIEQNGAFPASTLRAPPDEHLRQDAFFSFLELQCKSSPMKPSVPASPGERAGPPASWVKETSEGEVPGVNLALPELEFGNLDNTKPTENGSERSVEDDVGYDYMLDLSVNEDCELDSLNPPNSHTGGKWKPGSLPDLPTRDAKWPLSPSPPPASHTKGKWLPGDRKVDHNYYTDNEKDTECGEPDSDKLDSSDKHDADDNHGASDKLDPSDKHDADDNQDASDKHNSSDKCDNINNEVFHCTKCNRHLSSKYAYFRHVNSPYHLKRAQSNTANAKDSDLVDISNTDHDSATGKLYTAKDGCGDNNSAVLNHKLFSKHTKRTTDSSNKENADKNMCKDVVHVVIRKSPRKRTINKFMLGSEFVTNTSIISNGGSREARACRPTDELECAPCERSFTNKRSLALHLVSSLHMKRSEHHPDRHAMIFRNLDLLTKQAPFQCGICSYYFNHHSDFMEHWRSISHKDTIKGMVGTFFCLGCDYLCDKNEEMHAHLLSGEHQDLITLVNRKEPIVVKEKRTELKCRQCGSTFQTAFALRKHENSSAHEKLLPSKEKLRWECKDCDSKTFTTRTNLEIHVRRHHTLVKPFKCEPCNKAFCDAGSWKAHKMSSRHKRQISADQFAKSEKTCPVCKEEYIDIAQLKYHFANEHPDQMKKCEKCQGVFSLESEYNMHLCQKVKMEPDEAVNCDLNPVAETTGEPVFSCSECKYICHSSSEIAYHHILHRLPEEVPVAVATPVDTSVVILTADAEDAPIENKEVEPNKKQHLQLLKLKVVKKYKCPYCHKRYRKAALRPHLNIHTGERPFKCNFCNMGFAQKGTLYIHQKRHTGFKQFKCDQCSFAADKPSRVKRHKLIHESHRPRPCLCDICGAGYHDRWGLKHHMKLHFEKDYKCAHSGCQQAFRCQSELNIHMRIHTDERPFLCDMCGYRGRSQHQLTKHRRSHTGERPFKCRYCSYSAHLSPHLQRHMRIHTGSKPYKCPYCTYTCNTQENIRKHILKTKKHEGKKVYPCRFCDYGCNSASEYKNHILENHRSLVKNEETDVISLLAGVYERTDASMVDNPPIHYVPRKDRQKEKASGNAPTNVKKRKKKQPQPKIKVEDMEEAFTAAGQIVYTIQVPGQLDIVEAPTEEILQPLDNNPETILLPMHGVSMENCEEVQSEEAQIFIPTHVNDTIVSQDEDTIISEALREGSFVEGNGNTILIYMPVS